MGIGKNLDINLGYTTTYLYSSTRVYGEYNYNWRGQNRPTNVPSGNQPTMIFPAINLRDGADWQISVHPIHIPILSLSIAISPYHPISIMAMEAMAHSHHSPCTYWNGDFSI